MRTCQSCGKQNPPERDFCDCGEYLRWEPTGIVDAVTPEMAAAAVDAAPPATPDAAPAQPAAAPQSPAPPPAAAPQAPAPQQPAPAAAPPNGGQPVMRTQVQGAVPAPAAPVPVPEPEEPAEAAPASITLSLPDEESATGEILAVGVHPGDRTRVQALIRNQSRIVDNYQIRVEGLPDEWYSVLPDTVYLVPYGTGGTYEQQIEIHFHPPRVAEAEARIWELEVVAHSKAEERTAATEPLLLGIQPFTDHDTKVKPERASGRRKANFDVRVKNKANAPVFVAFDATEADNELKYRFDPAAAEIQPGETVTTRMRVKPPKQIWIGRPHERRIDVATKTGEEAQALAAAADGEPEEGLEEGGGVRGKLRGKKVPGVHGPQIYKPQIYKPNVHLGPGGLQVQKPMVRGPQVRGPQARGMNLNLNNLKMPGGQAPPAITGPLLPTQAVFRQKPWLPWWVAIVIPLLLLLALLLFLLLPKNVQVPDVVGKPSTFEAEKVITEAKLKLAADVKEKVDTKAEPGTILSQTPKAGEKAEEGGEVALLVAIGDGKVTVPDLTGKSPADAEKALREKNLSLGQVTPQPPDPKGEIKTQIPAAGETVSEGKPVDIFLVVKKADGTVVAAKPGGGEEEGGSGGSGGDDGGDEGGPLKVPEIDGAAQDAYAQKAGDLGLSPQVKREFNEDLEKGAIIRVDPKPGTEVKSGDDVTVFVSAGFPELAYDNNRDVLRIGGAKGAKRPAVAKGTQEEKDPAWSADGSSIAYTSAGQIFLRNVVKKDAAPKPLTKKGESFRDLAWAPNADVNTLAMIKEVTGPAATDLKTVLCLGSIGSDGMETGCKEDSDNILGRKLNWRPNGKDLLVFGAKPDLSAFGMIRYHSEVPYSADPADWESKGFVTDVSAPGTGVLDAAWSPDGKQLAAVVLDSNGRTNLMLTTGDDLGVANGEPLGVRACKVIWRPDGRQVVVIRSDVCIGAGGSETGELLRLPIDDPKDQQSLGLNGDNATFQPLSAD